ncbi:hypothetical protein K2173_015085 [Erythroxylum novogranatense]|uniref:Pseudouridine synthase I TruA alpha/beta domain-containing protein n=1 Tax=Erythroxylum novogranatense TaxID=1862640 RepID=A0AAV8T2I2_9ROSI|nr:hypothetical protein K2173_015085 [Erythroxylum novogranatense]
MSLLVEDEVVIDLRTQIASLQNRVKELESERARLFLRLSNCRCNEMGEKLHEFAPQYKSSMEEIGKRNSIGEAKKEEKISTKQDYETRIMKHHLKRHVALKVMYFGRRFYGFASEAQMDPTIESEIFKALEKTRLLVGEKKEIQYSRCGRTDKGVSAVGQVISLFLRSKLRRINTGNENSEETNLEDQNEGEIDYVRVLNRALPSDIRIIGWCPVPNDFSARFSCLQREYTYLFWGDSLNILDMEIAGQKFIGEHDFRNFCKMDVTNVRNYKRSISLFEIHPCDQRIGDSQLYAIKIKGRAFLWHQVRCMVAVLFMIGQGLESPDVIDALLDIRQTPRKPQYLMASDIPLVLQSCEFEGLKFKCSLDALQAVRVHLDNECRMYLLQAAIFHEAFLSCLHLPNCASTSSKLMKKTSSHVPLLSRQTEPGKMTSTGFCSLFGSESSSLRYCLNLFQLHTKSDVVNW